MRKKVVVLGATGSIGVSTLRVLQEQDKQFELILASAHHNPSSLLELAAHQPLPHIAITSEAPQRYDAPAGTHIHYGQDATLSLLDELDYDICVQAVSGSAGLPYTLAVLKRGKRLALANKESLVMAGHIVNRLTEQYGSEILPVDSEHSAIFQAIGTHPTREISRIHITASGGTFRKLPLSDFASITVEQALRHPNWDMGAKVTLDSATMFNKALEVIEAHWLFNLEWDRIKAVIHPQSVIHSLVEYVDGSFLAQMSQPDMMLPILYALSYPQRFPSLLVKTDLLSLPPLEFEPIDIKRYPLFYIGVQAGRAGGLYPTIANAANEAALKLFLQRRIPFTAIADKVKQALDEAEEKSQPDIEEILHCQQMTYDQVLEQG